MVVSAFRKLGGNCGAEHRLAGLHLLSELQLLLSLFHLRNHVGRCFLMVLMLQQKTSRGLKKKKWGCKVHVGQLRAR